MQLASPSVFFLADASLDPHLLEPHWEALSHVIITTSTSLLSTIPTRTNTNNENQKTKKPKQQMKTFFPQTGSLLAQNVYGSRCKDHCGRKEFANSMEWWLH